MITKKGQCDSWIIVGDGRNQADRCTVIYCQKAQGHAGDHRGNRAQWQTTKSGNKRVPVTEKLPE